MRQMGPQGATGARENGKLRANWICTLWEVTRSAIKLSICRDQISDKHRGQRRRRTLVQDNTPGTLSHHSSIRYVE